MLYLEQRDIALAVENMRQKNEMIGIYLDVEANADLSDDEDNTLSHRLGIEEDKVISKPH